MIIYYDLVFIETFTINSLIIEGIYCIFNEKLKVGRMILSGIFASIFLLIFLYPIGRLAVLRYLLGIILALIAFPKENIKRRIVKIALFYLLNLGLIGSLQVFKIKNFFLCIISTLVVITFGIIFSINKGNIDKVYINHKGYHALYDSGNSSYYLNIPIIYLDKSKFSKEFIFKDKVMIRTISGESLIDIYNGPKLMIKNTSYHVFYAFTKIDNYDIILHKDIGG